MNADAIRDMQRDAAYQDMLAANADHDRITKLILGDRPGRGHLSDLIKLGDNDYLAQITTKTGSLWTTVVNGQPSSTHHHTQDMALLHLVARRHDDNPNDSYQAARFAGRALGVTGN